MAFLTKKEQALINFINANSSISSVEKEEKIKSVQYNARLRQDGYRKKVKIFFSVMANYTTGKMIKDYL